MALHHNCLRNNWETTGNRPIAFALIRTGVSVDLREQARKGLLDVALLLDKPFTDDTLIIKPLRQERLLILVSPTHPLAAKVSVLASDLESETIIVPEPGSYRAVFEKYLDENGVRMTSTIEFSSIEAIKQCVIAGIGITLLPEMTVFRELSNWELIAIEWKDAAYPITTQLCWNRNKWLSPAASAFIDLVQEWII